MSAEYLEVLRREACGLRNSLTQMEEFNPQGNHSQMKHRIAAFEWAITKLSPEAPEPMYKYCPICGAEGVSRERRINGNDTCRNGHTYRSVMATPTPISSDKVSEIGQEAIYYMRDNHTFKKLSKVVSVAMGELEYELESGASSGMLCSKRPGFVNIHAREDKANFLIECKRVLIRESNQE